MQYNTKEGANMETIHETYKRQICSNCKNRNENLCNIRKDIKGTLKCINYIQDKQYKGYKQFQGRTAKQEKPIMRINI